MPFRVQAELLLWSDLQVGRWQCNQVYPCLHSLLLRSKLCPSVQFMAPHDGRGQLGMPALSFNDWDAAQRPLSQAALTLSGCSNTIVWRHKAALLQMSRICRRRAERQRSRPQRRHGGKRNSAAISKSCR